MNFPCAAVDRMGHQQALVVRTFDRIDTGPCGCRDASVRSINAAHRVVGRRTRAAPRSSPDCRTSACRPGPKSATASSRLSTTDSKSVGGGERLGPRLGELRADRVERAAEILELVPCGRSSRTSSSPRPRRVRPLWITWIGRSIHCASASRPAWRGSAPSTMFCIAVLNAARSSPFTRIVEMPIRIDAELTDRPAAAAAASRRCDRN